VTVVSQQAATYATKSIPSLCSRLPWWYACTVVEHIRRPAGCKPCHTSPEKQADSVYRRKCGIAYSKGPQEPVLYYSCGNILLTIYSDGSWEVELETTIEDLKEYLLSLPDRKSPTAT